MLFRLMNTPAYDVFDWFHYGQQPQPNIIKSLCSYKCLKLTRINQKLLIEEKLENMAQLHNFISIIVVTHYFNNIKQWKVTLCNSLYDITWRNTWSVFGMCPLLLQGHFHMFTKSKKRLISIHTENQIRDQMDFEDMWTLHTKRNHGPDSP